MKCALLAEMTKDYADQVATAVAAKLAARAAARATKAIKAHLLANGYKGTKREIARLAVNCKGQSWERDVKIAGVSWIL